MKKVSLQEMKIRTKEFKGKIYYLKKCNVRIYYNPEVINKIIFIEIKDFQNLLNNLELFEITLIKDKRLGKFQQSLWQIDVDNHKHKMILTSQNKEINQEVTLKIDLESNNKIIITKKIF